MSLTLWEIAYIAGFFDGEGCIYAHHSSAYIQIEIGQNDRRPLDFIQQRYGGRVRCRKNFYKWLCPSSETIRFLQDIAPFLIVKKEQAELALQFKQLRMPTNRRAKNEEVYAARKLVSDAITEAKKCRS